MLLIVRLAIGPFLSFLIFSLFSTSILVSFGVLFRIYTKGSTKGNIKSSKKVKKDHIKSTLSEDVKKWRLDMGITQEELADLLHVNRKAVGEWERGEKRPNKT